VPLIIRTPRHEHEHGHGHGHGHGRGHSYSHSGSAVRVVHEPVELIDVYPTLVELSGAPPVPPRHKLMGRSLRPALFNFNATTASPSPSRQQWAAKEGVLTREQWAAKAVAISQWPFGHDWSHAQPCMGYSVRLPGWTLVQWVHSPMRCTAHRCDGPIRGRDRAHWARLARLRDPCVSNADLFRTPTTYGVRPELEPERQNVISKHAEQVRRMRRLLARTMQIPMRAVGLQPETRRGLAGRDSLGTPRTYEPPRGRRNRHDLGSRAGDTHDMTRVPSAPLE